MELGTSPGSAGCELHELRQKLAAMESVLVAAGVTPADARPEEPPVTSTVPVLSHRQRRFQLQKEQFLAELRRPMNQPAPVVQPAAEHTRAPPMGTVADLLPQRPPRAGACPLRFRLTLLLGIRGQVPQGHTERVVAAWLHQKLRLRELGTQLAVQVCNPDPPNPLNPTVQLPLNL